MTNQLLSAGEKNGYPPPNLLGYFNVISWALFFASLDTSVNRACKGTQNGDETGFFGYPIRSISAPKARQQSCFLGLVYQTVRPCVS